MTSESVAWEEVCCVLCGGPHHQPLVEAADVQGRTGLRFAVVQCQDCGMCFTNPRPKGRSLARFYPRDYRPHQLGSDDRPRRAKLAPPRRNSPIPWHGEGRLLDFGCGGGAFLLEMQRHGWDVAGIDIARDTVDRLRDELGLRAFAGTLPHEELPPENFDVVTMWQSLEHVPHPKRVLTEARRLLAPDGKIYIAVPNIDSLAFRVFGSNWFGLDLPRHLSHFTPWTLQLMLERSGFRVEQLRMVRQSSWLRHSARLARSSTRRSWKQRVLRWKWFSRLVAGYSCLTAQSDCILAVATVREELE